MPPDAGQHAATAADGANGASAKPPPASQRVQFKITSMATAATVVRSANKLRDMATRSRQRCNSDTVHAVSEEPDSGRGEEKAAIGAALAAQSRSMQLGTDKLAVLAQRSGGVGFGSPGANGGPGPAGADGRGPPPITATVVASPLGRPPG